MDKPYVIEKDWMYLGMRCVVIFVNLGHRCGYVGIPVEHPMAGCGERDFYDFASIRKIKGLIDGEEKEFFELSYRDTVYPLSCHGGITYSSDNKTYPVESDLYWLGFDAGHHLDNPDNISLEKYFPNARTRVRNPYANGEIRTLEYMQKEVEGLADQLHFIAENNPDHSN